jgi:hypothetical protein
MIEADWPIQNSTLAVSLQEAAALTFTNGGTVGTALKEIVKRAIG